MRRRPRFPTSCQRPVAKTWRGTPMSAVDADGVQEHTRAGSQSKRFASASCERPRSPQLEFKDIIIPIGDPLRLDTGDILPDAYIRARRFGREHAPTILVMGGISSGRKVAGADGWWRDLIDI